jgi:hypothetical protein
MSDTLRQQAEALARRIYVSAWDWSLPLGELEEKLVEFAAEALTAQQDIRLPALRALVERWREQAAKSERYGGAARAECADELDAAIGSTSPQGATDLAAELAVTEALLAERQRVLDAIPPCPTHGANCVPHALDWVRRRIGAGSGGVWVGQSDKAREGEGEHG